MEKENDLSEASGSECLKDNIVNSEESLCVASRSYDSSDLKSSKNLPSSSSEMKETSVISGSTDKKLTLMFGNGTSAQSETKSALFEFGKSQMVHDISSGFNSADSTNDDDFFTTQEAVESAIEVMNRGLNEEGEDKLYSDKLKEDSSNNYENKSGIIGNNAKENTGTVDNCNVDIGNKCDLSTEQKDECSEAGIDIIGINLINQNKEKNNPQTPMVEGDIIDSDKILKYDNLADVDLENECDLSIKQKSKSSENGIDVVGINIINQNREESDPQTPMVVGDIDSDKILKDDSSADDKTLQGPEKTKQNSTKIGSSGTESCPTVIYQNATEKEGHKLYSDELKDGRDSKSRIKDNNVKNSEGTVDNCIAGIGNANYLSTEQKGSSYEAGIDIVEINIIKPNEEKMNTQEPMQVEYIDSDKFSKDDSSNEENTEGLEKTKRHLTKSENSGKENCNIEKIIECVKIQKHTIEDGSGPDQNMKETSNFNTINDNNIESDTIGSDENNIKQLKKENTIKGYGNDSQCGTGNYENEDIEAKSVDIGSENCSTLIVSKAPEDITLSHSNTSNEDNVDIVIESQHSSDSKVNESIEKIAEGSEISVTLENFEVSVFDEGLTDDLASGILGLLKDVKDEIVPCEIKPDIATKNVNEKLEQFEAGESCDLNDSNSFKQENEFKLDDGIISSDEEEEEVFNNRKDISSPVTTLISQTIDIKKHDELMEVDGDKSSEKEVNNLKETELCDTSQPVFKENSDEKEEINENSVKYESASFNSADTNSISMITSKCLEEKTHSLPKSFLSETKPVEFLQSDSKRTIGESLEEKMDSLFASIRNETETVESINSEMVTGKSIKENPDYSFINNKSDYIGNNDTHKLQSDDELFDTSANAALLDVARLALAKNKEFLNNWSSELEVPIINVGKSENINIIDDTSTKEAEVISLVDDEEDESKQRKKPAAAIKCVNPNCMSGEGLVKPAMFVLTYFGLKRAKDQQVCVECFNKVVEHNEKLACLLKENKPLFSADFPNHRDVILLDSDEESYSDDESVLSDDTMEMIRDNLDDVITESLSKFGLDHQIRESCGYLNNDLDRLEDDSDALRRSFNRVQVTLDQCRQQIYKEYENEIRSSGEVHFTHCEIPPMPILRSKFQNRIYSKNLMNYLRRNQEDRSVSPRQSTSATKTIATKKVSQISQSSYENVVQDIIAVHSEQKCDPPPTLPPPGPLVRNKLKVGDLAYTMKVSYFSVWVLCRVMEVIPRNVTENDTSTETYRVRLENMKKSQVRTVTGKYLAYHSPARVQLKVGTRVIAIFYDEDEAVNSRSNYYVGVIAEPPKSTNKYRYLVFFDDGYTQYCPHDNILVVCHTSRNVWEDIHPDPRDFIRDYLQQYPERPMVKMSQGQIVKVEWNGKWWIVKVVEVDASLVKVHFEADKRTEWIYRGSTRLGPMYQELAAAKDRQSGSLRSRGFGSAVTPKKDVPYVEYTRGDSDEKKDEEPEEQEEQAVVPTRSVARKSTAKKPQEPVISNIPYAKPLVTHIPLGKVTQRVLNTRCKPIQFRPHQCNQACVKWTDYSPAAAKEYDPLVKPLMFGFSRLDVSYKGKSTIMYKAPCGRTIRNQQEMLCYLQGTRSSLTIDLFDFDFWVNPLNEFKEATTFGRIEDLSYGKENVPISCVNELDHSMPQYVQYMTARQPAKTVNLNLDEEFLVGCDCKDDCEDKEKCSCWQLTMQGKSYIPDGDLDPLFGYQYRRLPERIATGIYECNSRCKCSATCQNRVAQQPLSCRLQLFKTLKKGWGIRCHHDIPRGAFICIYAGFLLTELEANEGGKAYGDEYLAELDYIESVENLKEGYETEAREFSEDDDGNEESGSFSSFMRSGYSQSQSAKQRTRTGSRTAIDFEYEEEQPQSEDSDAEDSNRHRREDIRLRLRRRVVEEGERESSRRSRTENDAISISDEEVNSDSGRKFQFFNAKIRENAEDDVKYQSVRDMFGKDEHVYIMDAKTHGNIGRYLNHSCSPNVFVQNVFVDTHDLRFPWVAFFANQYIPAGTELTWDYNYDVGSVPDKVMLCYCNSNNCRGRLL